MTKPPTAQALEILFVCILFVLMSVTLINATLFFKDLRQLFLLSEFEVCTYE